MRELKVKVVDTKFGRLHLIENDVVSRTLEEGNHWNPHVYNALEPFLDGIVFDVGANVGALTMRFAEKARTVYAFEPHPVLTRCLMANTRNNVFYFPQGLYSRPCWLAPWASWDDEDPSSWAWLPVAGDKRPSLYALAGPLESLPIHRVSAIKVDAQGADLHVMYGLDDLIRRDRPRIVFEFEGSLSEKHGHRWENYVEYLERQQGYTISPLGEGDHFAEPR